MSPLLRIPSSYQKMEKTTFGFHEIWQILKHFAETFLKAQTLKLGGVDTSKYLLMCSFVLDLLKRY